jgi:plastocyanin
MRPLPKLALLAACLLVLGPQGSAAEPGPAVTTCTVTIENLQFSPAELAVRRGDRIVWVNKDFFSAYGYGEGQGV